MDKLIDLIKAAATKSNRVTYREREAHYASNTMACLRDQFWSWKGEKETNPTDFQGAMKMLLGDAVEKQLVSSVFNQLAPLGCVSKTQVPIGGTNPLEGAIYPWHGYLDILMAQREGDSWKKFPIEIKTKSGYGAKMFAANPEPDKSYMLQLGLYLYELYKKEGITYGCFLYVLLNDDSFGDVILIHVGYDPGTHVVTAYAFDKANGTSGSLSVQYNVMEAFERFRRLDLALESGTEPAPEYKYKYDLTPEFLRDLSDAQLKKLIDGYAIIGDWQPLYSRYKDKQLLTDGLSPVRTEEEKHLAKVEYRRRHPRSKI